MSSTPPPASPPPAGPPSGPPPEYLDSGAGAPVPSEPRRGGSPVRRGLVLGGGVVGLVAVGVGAWAAYSFFRTGPQPAEALPAKTLGYASIDLDPSGGQKIAALRTLNKFPAFKDKIGISSTDDLRKAIFEKVDGEAKCDGLSYSDDIEPWLGDRAAVAAVDVGDDHPDVVVVLQVTDADKADAGLKKIRDCAEDGGTDGGWKISDGWAVVGESDSIADKVADAAAQHSLADDADFKKWTGEAGDSGVATFYASPLAGDYLADHVDGMFGIPFSVLGGNTACFTDVGPQVDGDDSSTAYEGHVCDDAVPSDFSDDLTQRLRDFKGMAATIRFDGGAIELESAGDTGAGASTFLAGGGNAELVQSLPGDTAAALGLGFKAGWFSDIIDSAASSTGQDPDELMSQLSDMTGLDLPADAETLAGDQAALALGPDFDPGSFASSEDGSDVPIALKVKGDPDAIGKVLDKLRDNDGPQLAVLDSDQDGDTIAIGPDADYRADVLKDGDLGDNQVFKDVVPDADKAQSVLFVNVDQLEKAIEAGAGQSEQELLDNLEVLSGVGVSGWVDDGVSHSVVRLATD